MVFGMRRVRGSERYMRYGHSGLWRDAQESISLHVAFGLSEAEDENVLCPIPLNNIDEEHKICLASGDYHYDFPANRFNFDDLIRMFWSNTFGGYHGGFSDVVKQAFGGSLHSWEQLSPDECCQRLQGLKEGHCLGEGVPEGINNWMRTRRNRGTFFPLSQLFSGYYR